MVVVLSREDVLSVLQMPELVDAVESALVESALGRTIQPLRLRLFAPETGTMMACMPAYLGDSGVMGAKIVCSRDPGVAQASDRRTAAIVLLSNTGGEFLAIMHGTSIGAFRTGAASAVATKYLAAPDARVLGMVGAGIQARSELWAMLTVRPIRRVKVYDVTAERALRFEAEVEERYGLPVEVCDSAEAAVRDSDVVVTSTTSRTPVLQGAWLKEGAHVNAVGAHTPDTRELDSEAICRAKVVGESLAALFAEAGDVLIPISEGRITRDHVYGEIGEIAAGRRLGRASPREITIFKSVGIAVEDVVTAKLVYERAREQGLGTEIAM